MDQASFESFIKQHQPLQQVDPEAAPKRQTSDQEELKQWLTYLDQLYADIGSHLEPYIQIGQIKFELGTVRLFEEQVGFYEAPSLLLRVGRTIIQFEPVGTFLIGTKGRVEVTGPAGSATLILVSKEARDVASMVRVTPNTASSHVNVAVAIGPHMSDLPIVWVWKLITASAQRTFVDFTAETLYEIIAALSPA